ncbi:MAG: 30S ribosomal protein S19e [Candidatus Aenigmarchaeota archaeon]|nr:30S ribosomal protein S19e [Candidatus Aenigmarchaeota archaeon]
MVSIRDVNQSLLVKKASLELEKRIQMPEWANFVKTGVCKERPPEQKDWWFLRTASLLRKVYMDGPIGVSKLRSYYGGLRNLGHKPSHFKKAGGKVIRTSLQELERAGLIEKVNKPKKGRIVTKEGQRFLDKIAKDCKS